MFVFVRSLPVRFKLVHYLRLSVHKFQLLVNFFGCVPSLFVGLPNKTKNVLFLVSLFVISGYVSNSK